jgi:hypothetical protein
MDAPPEDWDRENEFYFRIDGLQYGPVTRQHLRTLPKDLLEALGIRLED